ncbi:MAG: Mov34/MPN/PAD-1 family protein [Promethearchaeota archaeon]
MLSKCLCALSDYFKMAIFADFAAPNECSGVLAGYCVNDSIFIDQTLTLRTGRRVRVELEPQDYAKIAQLDRKLLTQHKYIVGWFHSHSGGIFFSGTDEATHRQWTTHFADAIGIVLDASHLRRKKAMGCFIYNKSRDEFKQIPTVLFKDSNASLDQILSQALPNSLNNFQKEIISHFKAHQEIFEDIFHQEQAQALQVIKAQDITSNTVYYFEQDSNFEHELHLLLNKRCAEKTEIQIKKITQKETLTWEFRTEKEN